MIAKVLVEISHSSIDKTFDYKVPFLLEQEIAIGQRVVVPFASMTLEGFVVGFSDKSDQAELKEIVDIASREFYLSDELLSLAEEIANETLSTKISALQVMLPKGAKASFKGKVNTKLVTYLELTNQDTITTSDSQEKLVSYLKEHGKVAKSKLLNFSPSSINTLIKKGYIIVSYEEEYRLAEKSDKTKEFIPTDLQQKTLDKILSKSAEKPFLLHGITGSGKTVIYIELIKKILKEGKTAILLLPEISITVQTINLFRSHFDEEIAVYHSRLSDGERYDEYRRIYRGEVKIVIGARSAIFAPLKNIGAIIIDEEHSSSYRQESSPRYDTIEVAKKRAKTHGATLLLGSATPSLESFARAKKGVYELLTMDQRPFDISLPKVEIVDLAKVKNRRSIFSEELINEINKSLEADKQVMILLNRRGFSNYLLCSNCGYAHKCPNCDISLTYHKSSNMMRCHYCGYADKKPDVCPSCGEDALKSLGTGTEKVEEELKKLFNTKVLRMDLDTTSTKGAHQKIIDAFRRKEAMILLGTQMISKGLDFENVNLVGIVSADTSLMIPNFRASEETFQLLSQVAGRAGRKGDPSKVIIQTYNPDHYAITYAKNHDYLGFYEEEMKYRKVLSYPPFYYLVLIKVISKDYDLASKASGQLAHRLKSELSPSTSVLGPSVASVFKLRGNYHFNILIKYKYDDLLLSVLKNNKEHFMSNKLNIDVTFNPWFI